MNDQYIWDTLNYAIRNDYGTAALMGNLQAESGLISFRLQGDFTSGYIRSRNYTNNVDNGSYSEYDFVHDSKGYGLAQWTYYTRKQALYDKHISMGLSIGSVELGCAYLIEELQASYPSVWATLTSATDIRTPSDAVLHDFENPQEQGPAVEAYRESLGIAIYNTYSGQPIPPTPPTPPGPPPTSPALPVWMLFSFDNG